MATLLAQKNNQSGNRQTFPDRCFALRQGRARVEGLEIQGYALYLEPFNPYRRQPLILHSVGDRTHSHLRPMVLQHGGLNDRIVGNGKQRVRQNAR